MRRFIIFVIAIITSLLLVGCDSGLLVISLEISKYPDRIVYYAGIDEELDLTGGEVLRATKSGRGKPESMEDPFLVVSHDIDFDVPGVYVVEISSGKFKCNFPVQVVEK